MSITVVGFFGSPVANVVFLLKCRAPASVGVLTISASSLSEKGPVNEPHNGPGIDRRPGGVGYGPRL